MYEKFLGKIVKVSKIRPINFVYHGRLLEETEDILVVDDVLIGTIKLKKEDIEKIVPVDIGIWYKVVDKMTKKFGNNAIMNEEQLQKNFDDLKKKIRNEKNARNIHTGT